MKKTSDTKTTKATGMLKAVAQMTSLLKQRFQRFKQLFQQGKSASSPQRKFSPAQKVRSENAAQVAIERSKFSAPSQSQFQPPPAPQPSGADLPASYGDNKIILQVRDPWWLHSYWEVTQQEKDRLKHSLGDVFYQGQWTLRVYDITFIYFNGSNANSYFDITINAFANNWYVNVGSGRSYCIDLGLRLPDGRFITVVRSNVVNTPLDGPSSVIDEEWFIPEEEFMKFYGIFPGPGATSPGVKQMQMRKRIRFLEFISSPGSFFRTNPKKNK